MTNDPLTAPNEPTDVTISFQHGIPIKLATPQKTFTESVQLFKELNRIGKIHGTCFILNDVLIHCETKSRITDICANDLGVGRLDIVENRFIGLKSRGCKSSAKLLIILLDLIELKF